MQTFHLSNDSAERVLARLGLARRPDPTLEALRSLYAAWCRRVPFDNVRKLIHLRAGEPGPLPGESPDDFFAAWLAHGTGGTCWSGAGAFQALLASLGFDAERALATMLVAPDLPPNHGSVRVSFGDRQYLVDCSMLHGEPLPLMEGVETRVAHAAWGVTCAWRDGQWHVNWRPLHRADGLECRFEAFGLGHEDYCRRYDQTRGWGPFNYQVTARSNRDDRVIGLAFGKIVSLEADGRVREAPATDEERRALLIEEFGLSEEIVRQLPPDLPTPPPPWSRTAGVLAGTAVGAPA